MDKGFVIWLTGLSGAGKSTLAQRLQAVLKARSLRVEVLDGDEVRENLSKGLGFTKEDRDTNIRRIAYVASLLARNGVVTIVAAISPYRATREEARKRIGNFVEVYVKCPLPELVRRDVKGLYAKAIRGEISNFTGISDPYEEPENPEVVVDTFLLTPEEAVKAITRYLEHVGYLPPVDGLIAPYGGRLVDRFADPETREELRKRLADAPRVVLSRYSLANLELIGVGALSPLEGFMDSNEYRAVVEGMRLPTGLPWTIPVVLPVSPGEAATLEEGIDVALVDERGRIVGSLRVSEVFERDMERELHAVYRTTDPSHPGVAKVLAQGSLLLAGTVTLLEHPWSAPPAVAAGLADFTLSPREVRKAFADRGWRTVVGFQTRNPVHRAHEYIQKCALETCDGLLLHPLVGDTKEDDIPADVRLKCYLELVEHYYPAERILLSLLPANMHYAGPREAVHHAIIRRNFGCTHFIVGRDHAGVANFYGPYEAHEIFRRFGPQELGITPLFFEDAFYCSVCDGMATSKTCPHGDEQRVSLSGSKVRSMLRQGHRLPPEVTRPEVAEVLISALSPMFNQQSVPAAIQAQEERDVH